MSSKCPQASESAGAPRSRLRRLGGGWGTAYPLRQQWAVSDYPDKPGREAMEKDLPGGKWTACPHHCSSGRRFLVPFSVLCPSSRPNFARLVTVACHSFVKSKTP